MSKITKGCLAMIVGADYNNGATVTVGSFIGDIQSVYFPATDYWEVSMPRAIPNVLGMLITDGICREAFLKRISPPDDEHVPDPVEVDLPIKETV
jgi:hypothetical protein